MRKLIIVSFLILLFCDSYSQSNVRKKIFDAQKDAAYNYLTNANRPSPDFTSDMFLKDKGAIDLNFSSDGNYPDFDVTGTYGLSNSVNLIGTFTVYTTNYNLNGTKFNGVGDVLLSSRFLLDEGKYFSHYAQVSVKIPIAKSSDQLGTGKLDYHFGMIENFSDEKFSCDAAASFDMLGRPDFPTTKSKILILQQEIDSVKQFYDFSFQPNYTLSLYPTYSLTDNFSLSTGIDFARDMKLNSNSSTFYLGFGYDFSDKISLSAGSDFNILNSSNYDISGDLTISF